MRVARGKPLRHIIVVAFAWWAVSLCIALASGIKGVWARFTSSIAPAADGSDKVSLYAFHCALQALTPSSRRS